MSLIHYKFKAAKEYSTIVFDGLSIPVYDLKQEILKAKKLNVDEFDVNISNSQTGEEYYDDNILVPRNTSVFVRRIPYSGPPRSTQAILDKKDTFKNTKTFSSNYEAPQFQTNTNLMSTTQPTLDYLPGLGAPRTQNQDVQNENLQDTIVPDNLEDQRIAAMFQQSSEQWDYQQKLMENQKPVFHARPPGPGKPKVRPDGTMHARTKPPDSYVCFRCGLPGHWISDCPTIGRDGNQPGSSDTVKRVKRTTGIPKSFLQKVDKLEDGKHAMVTSDGTLVVATTNEDAWNEAVKIAKTSVAAGNTLGSLTDIPEDLKCKICSNLVRDAVSVPCCSAIFCAECIEQYLHQDPMQSSSDPSLCPVCKNEQIRLVYDQLIPDYETRTKVNDFIKSLSESQNVEPKNIDTNSNMNIIRPPGYIQPIGMPFPSIQQQQMMLSGGFPLHQQAMIHQQLMGMQNGQMMNPGMIPFNMAMGTFPPHMGRPPQMANNPNIINNQFIQNKQGIQIIPEKTAENVNIKINPTVDETPQISKVSIQSPKNLDYDQKSVKSYQNISPENRSSNGNKSKRESSTDKNRYGSRSDTHDSSKYSKSGDDRYSNNKPNKDYNKRDRSSESRNYSTKNDYSTSKSRRERSKDTRDGRTNKDYLNKRRRSRSRSPIDNRRRHGRDRSYSRLRDDRSSRYRDRSTDSRDNRSSRWSENSGSRVHSKSRNIADHEKSENRKHSNKDETNKRDRSRTRRDKSAETQSGKPESSGKHSSSEKSSKKSLVGESNNKYLDRRESKDDKNPQLKTKPDEERNTRSDHKNKSERTSSYKTLDYKYKRDESSTRNKGKDTKPTSSKTDSRSEPSDRKVSRDHPSEKLGSDNSRNKRHISDTKTSDKREAERRSERRGDMEKRREDIRTSNNSENDKKRSTSSSKPSASKSSKEISILGSAKRSQEPENSEKKHDSEKNKSKAKESQNNLTSRLGKPNTSNTEKSNDSQRSKDKSTSSSKSDRSENKPKR
ncbi:hypothetical protein BB558_003548 [Smittium angustum]|uniref:RING-type domain-containing protein n=1 Tax=Smittium angustum TaxID=133377 RepID=A0A2U1J5U8_SMIAN|nr:hypothetical protein BB558_003548 [Smittium angustum]